MKRLHRSPEPFVTFLWNKVYKGVEIVFYRRAYWIGWTTREWKRRGW